MKCQYCYSEMDLNDPENRGSFCNLQCLEAYLSIGEEEEECEEEEIKK